MTPSNSTCQVGRLPDVKNVFGLIVPGSKKIENVWNSSVTPVLNGWFGDTLPLNWKNDWPPAEVTPGKNPVALTSKL